MRTYYYAGAPRHPGTPLPSNVTGECPHEHRSPEAAQRCIDELDRSIKRGTNGHGHADRVVMVHWQDGPDAGLREVWQGADDR